MSVRRVHCEYEDRRVLLVIGEGWSLDDFKNQILVEFGLESECLDDYILLLKGSEVRSIAAIFCDDIVKLKKVIHRIGSKSTIPENAASPAAPTRVPSLFSRSASTVSPAPPRAIPKRAPTIGNNPDGDRPILPVPAKFASPAARASLAPPSTHSQTPSTPETIQNGNTAKSAMISSTFASPGASIPMRTRLAASLGRNRPPPTTPVIAPPPKPFPWMTRSKKRKLVEGDNDDMDDMQVEAEKTPLSSKRAKINDNQRVQLVEETEDEAEAGMDCDDEMLQLQNYDPKEIAIVNGVSSTRKRAEAALEILLKNGWVQLKEPSPDKAPWVDYIDLVIRRHEDNRLTDNSLPPRGGPGLNYVNVRLTHLLRACGVAVCEPEDPAIILGFVSKSIVPNIPIDLLTRYGEVSNDSGEVEEDSENRHVSEPPCISSSVCGLLFEYSAKDIEELNKIANLKERAERIMQHFEAKQWFPPATAFCDRRGAVEFIQEVLEACSGPKSRSLSRWSLCRDISKSGVSSNMRNVLVVILEAAGLVGDCKLSRTPSPAPRASGYVDITRIHRNFAPKFQPEPPAPSDPSTLSEPAESVKNEKLPNILQPIVDDQLAPPLLDQPPREALPEKPLDPDQIERPLRDGPLGDAPVEKEPIFYDQTALPIPDQPSVCSLPDTDPNDRMDVVVERPDPAVIADLHE